jgi:hypothetical protein
MRRIYHHFERWEDWRDGLYRLSVDSNADEILTDRAARLLADPDSLSAMMHAVEEYKCSAEVNLSNKRRNRQAWLGQAACCFVCGAPESLTKSAWHRLSPAEQDAANAVADKVIAMWEDRQCRSVA